MINILTIRNITKNFDDFADIKSLYKSSFPRNEQTPMFMLLNGARTGKAKFNAYYDKDLFAGFTYTTVHGDITCVQYLVVNTNYRSKGYGAKILEAVKEMHPQNRIALTIEKLDSDAENNEQRIKRRQFYIKNGYEPIGKVLRIFGADYEILSCNGVCSAEEFLQVSKNTLGRVLTIIARPKIKEIQ